MSFEYSISLPPFYLKEGEGDANTQATKSDPKTAVHPSILPSAENKEITIVGEPHSTPSIRNRSVTPSVAYISQNPTRDGRSGQVKGKETTDGD